METFNSQRMVAGSMSLLPKQYISPARVRKQRYVPLWFATSRWIVLRGGKTPRLAMYSDLSDCIADEKPINVILLGSDTILHVRGEKGICISSSLVQSNETWFLSFESGSHRRRMYEYAKRWIELSTFLAKLHDIQAIAMNKTATVYRAAHNAMPTQMYALKRINRMANWNELQVTERIATVDKLVPYIPKFFYIFEESRDNTVTIVMKYYPGGSLADRINDIGLLKASIIKHVLRSLIKAVTLLHRHGIYHLDIKSSNIVFDSQNSRDFHNLKLLDFGSSYIDAENDGMGTFPRRTTLLYGSRNENNDTAVAPHLAQPIPQHALGTYGCMAPERFEGQFGPQVDIYGIGVVLYQMVTRSLPFPGKDRMQIMARNVLGDINFDPQAWNHVDSKFLDLAKLLLCKDPNHRITLHEIHNMSWLMEKTVKSFDGHTP